MAAGNQPSITPAKRIIFALIMISFVFGSAELLLRLTGFSFNTGTYELIEGEVTEYHWSTRGLVRDPIIPWSWIPSPGAEATQPARNDFTYNKDGFRGPEVLKEKPANTIRVICMGDSCTLGWDAPDNETYPDYLRQKLREITTEEFQVINAGVSGFSSYQGLWDLKRRILDWQPDILVVSYNWNDHGDAPDRVYGPAVYTPNERRQFPDNAMPETRTGFTLKQYLTRIRLIQAVTKLVWTLQDRDVKQDSTPFPAGTGLRRVSAEDLRLNLWEFTRIANQHGITLIFMTQAANPAQHREIEPWKTYYAYQDQYNDVFRRVARETDTPLVDIASEPWWKEEHFYDHVHKRPSANRRIADAVSRQIFLTMARNQD